jgi:hypothetical protein
MSEDYTFTISKLVISVLGIVIFALGVILTFYSWTADVGIVSPRIFTSLGIVVAVNGVLLLIARGN